MIVYDSLYIFFLHVAAYIMMNFAVQVFKWTASPCQRRPPLTLLCTPSPSQNQSNTVQNESLKEGLCIGSYFRVVRHESKTFCSEFYILTKDTHAQRPYHASSIKLFTRPSKKNLKLRIARATHVHSSTHLHSSTQGRSIIGNK